MRENAVHPVRLRQLENCQQTSYRTALGILFFFSASLVCSGLVSEIVSLIFELDEDTVGE